jgi:hypothetical protein
MVETDCSQACFRELAAPPASGKGNDMAAPIWIETSTTQPAADGRVGTPVDTRDSIGREA